MRVKKQQSEPCMEQLIGSRLRKVYNRAVCLFNLYTECMRNAELDELQTRIRLGMRSINNLRYADDIPLMAESQEELESLDEGEGRE